MRKRPISSFEDVIGFRFKTNVANGHILYSRGTQKDIFSLRLQDNKLVINLDLGGEGDLNHITAGSLLDDNQWHDVFFARSNRDILLTVDGSMVRHKITGDFIRLDLNHAMYIGGIPVSVQSEVESIGSANYSGCIEELYFNRTNVISELKVDGRQWLYQRFGDLYFGCRQDAITPLTFQTDSAHIKIDGFFNPFMNCSLDFRTFNPDGVLLYNKFSSVSGFIKVYLDKGRLLTQIQGTDTPVVILDPFPDTLLHDGLWHETRIVLKTDNIIIEIDNRTSYTVRKFSMTTGQTYLLAGGVFGSPGFIGCMRNLYIEGRYVSKVITSSIYPGIFYGKR